MKKIWTVALCAVVLLLVAAAPALAGIEIRRINFDPAGRDTGTNSHLNREYIQIRNMGNQRTNLRGWIINDRAGEHIYRIQERIVLGPDDRLRVHSGRGRPAGECLALECAGPVMHHRYWGLTEYVWDNNGDRATLVNDSGNVVDRCRYGSDATNPRPC
jgi:hypothetical protein